MKNDFEQIWLNEFEHQIDDIMLYCVNNEVNFNEIINFINFQKHCWSTCRFDIENKGNIFNRINILENSNNLNIIFPEWFRSQNGQGCKIEGSVNKLNLKLQCVNEGTLTVSLRGMDYRNLEQLRCPFYINFTKFKINNNLIFNENMLVWHDQPYEFEIISEDKQMFNIYLEFKTIFDYYPSLDLFNNVKDMEDLNNNYLRFKNVKFNLN